MLSCFSRVQLFVTLWTVACQAPLSLEFSKKELLECSHVPVIRPSLPNNPKTLQTTFLLCLLDLLGSVKQGPLRETPGQKRKKGLIHFCLAPILISITLTMTTLLSSSICSQLTIFP